MGGWLPPWPGLRPTVLFPAEIRLQSLPGCSLKADTVWARSRYVTVSSLAPNLWRSMNMMGVGQEERTASSNINCSMRATETEENVVTIGIPLFAFVE